MLEGVMSHGVHAVQHEVEHHIEHEHGHGTHAKKPAENQNKKIALLISVIALLLAISETLGKSAQTVGIELNIKASDSWNFFQAKTIRQTTLRTAAEALAVEVAARPDDAYKTAMSKQVDAWTATVKRYDSDPKEKDGRKELRAQAEQYERERDVAMARYHNYELGSAAYQIGIVLASAAVITGMIALVYGAAGVAAIGLIFTGFGLFAPNLPHDLIHWVSQFSAATASH
jgi:metal-dependent amidase/aminoacylase/carboxypeptidase family protein